MYSIVFVFIVFMASQVMASDILEFRLVKDGSVEPPGDRLTLTALLLPLETELKYEVRLLEIMENGKHVAIRGTGHSGLRAAGAELVFSGSLRRLPDAIGLYRAQEHIPIPYREIDLEAGVHAIYYEATLTALKKEKPLEPIVMASRLTQVTVGDGVRETITRAKQIDPKVADEWRKVRAYAMNPEGKVESATTEVASATISAGAFEPETVKVVIPGKFERKEIAGRPVHPTVALSKFVPERLRIVRFATNRLPVDVSDLKKGFTDKLDVLTYGTCTVNIPVTTHKKGEMKTPGWFGSNPKTDFSIEMILPKDEAPFYSEMKDNDKLLYVHGYRNKFNDAILTAAQLQHDIEFGGKVVAFSWPSSGTATGYWEDEKKAEKSVEALATVIEKLIRESEGGSSVNLVAHSMGNRITLYALSKLITESRLQPDQKVIGHLVLAAPDVDINVFMSLIGRVSKIVQKVTFYYSTKDTALWLSSKEHPMNRAGSHPTFVEGMDTISVDNVNSAFASYGHGYFTTSDRVLLDLKLDVVRGLSVSSRRPPLKAVEYLKHFPGFPHYSFIAN